MPNETPDIAGARRPDENPIPVPDTSTRLLRNLEKGADAERWPEFERKYDPVVRKFLDIVARSHPLVDESGRDDIAQETMVALWRLFPRHAYDRSQGRFRDWLFGVTRLVAVKASSRELERRLREAEAVRGAAETSAEIAETAEFREEAEALWREAVDRVFAEGKWSEKAKAFYIRTEHGEDIAEVARAYGMTPNAAYQLRYRVSRRVEAVLRKCVEIASAKP